MKENVLDVLMYLFETYIETESDSESSHNNLRIDLIKAGFKNNEIDKALDWLDGLTKGNAGTIGKLHDNNANRIYNDIERNHLDSNCRGFICHLEQINILSAPQRELLIDRLLALGINKIDIDQIKWIVLMILFSQPGQESAYTKMEGLLFDSKGDFFH